jgi:TP901 family phage tail tape measure protein
MKGFKVEAKDALDIVDQLSAVDMASATDVGGLAEGMSKTAVTAQNAGIEMQRLIGYIATVGEVTQADMGSVGNAFKTIFTRMSDIKAGKLKLIDEDGTTEILSDVEQTLANVGIDLRKTVTEYNDYGDVLDNLAAKWDTLSEVQQNALAKAFAGTRQAEVFRSLMANYDNAKKYMEIANDSSGYATEKFEAYKDSLSGAIEGFKNSFQTLSNTVVGSDFLKGIVNLGTTSLNILDSVIEKLDVIPSLLSAIGIYQGFKGGGWSSQKIVCVSL